jgi:hypothetical protein
MPMLSQGANPVEDSSPAMKIKNKKKMNKVPNISRNCQIMQEHFRDYIGLNRKKLPTIMERHL